jgi:starch-binding outer membrane protein, SusD/RagB family
MLRNMRVVLVSLGLVLGAAGCNGFLTGDKLSSNPNSPSTATIQTLFVAMQGAQFAEHEGPIAMLECEWVQTCGAVNGRFVELGGRYNYGANSNFGAEAGDWATIYTGGGLIDIRNIKAGATASGDSVYLGITKIWEAFTMGMAADMWSGIPYSQAGVNATPDTDSEIGVYNAVQTLLSQAISELTNDNVATDGPLSSDLVFGRLSPANQRTAWIATAWTLKARYWLHVVNAAANGKVSGLTAPQVYDSAIAAATNGISDPTGAHDFHSVHFAATTQQNMWSQFQQFSGFGADLEAGKPLVDYMKARNDPRIPLYFCKDKVGGYGGDSFNTLINPDSVSNFSCLPPRFAPTSSVPYVTYAERELILAEANSTTARGAGGNDATALGYLNAELAVPGSASGVTVTALPPVVGVTGAALRDSIMLEKWVVMFQNIEGLLDYRRTCRPAITPVTGNFLGIAFVPGRLFYPQSERNVNPAHIPLESAELGAGLRTQADVSTPCHP